MAKSTVAVKFTGDTSDLKRATADAESGLKGFGSKVGPALTKAMAGAGLAAGGALVDGFVEKIDREKTQARVIGSLGLSDEEADRLGKVAGEIYSDGFGESFEQVTEATGTVMKQLEDFADPDQLEPITKKALDLSYIFEQDVGATIDAVRYLLVNGLAPDAENAFDVITAALQRVPAEMRGEVMDAVGEYAQSFAALGFDAQESLELLVAAGQDTSVGIDKVGDSMKEFLIRATDGTTATVEALEAIGLPAEQISNDLLAGGDAADEAFQKIVTALLSVEDPSARAQFAVALFGTPIEDLSVNKIPTFLEALGGVEDGFGDVQQASEDATAAMDDDARQYQQSMRKLEEFQQEFVNRFILGLEKWQAMIGLTLQNAAGLFESFQGVAEDALDAVGDAFNGPISKANELIELLGKIPGVADTVNNVIDKIPGGPKKSSLTLPSVPTGGGSGPGGKIGGIPEFALGGTVPGPKGKPRMIVAHGGEEVRTTAEVDAEKRAARALPSTVRDVTRNYNFTVYANNVPTEKAIFDRLLELEFLVSAS